MKFRSLIALPLLHLALAFACQAQQPVPQHGVTVTWTYPTGTAVNKFQVSKGTALAGPYPAVVCSTTSIVFSCFDAAAAGTTNYYVVQAFDPINGWSPVSNEACAGTSCVPSTPIPATTGAPTGAIAATK